MLDLTRPAYRVVIDLIAVLRTDPGAWDRIRCRSVRDPGRGTHDTNQRTRGQVACLLALCGPRDDAALLRRLLAEEIEARRTDSFQGAGETLTTLSALLLDCGDASDATLFWRAKTANFDTLAGGYDLQFVFALGDPQATRQALMKADPDRAALLHKLDLPLPADGQAAWRASLAGHVPRDLAGLTVAAAQEIAERFDDREAVERLGRQAARGPEDLARLCQKLGYHAEALSHWRAAAAAATTSWDQASARVYAVSAAAKARLDGLADVEALDVLRRDIPSWRRVGLGRMATQAAYELAQALPAPQGATAFARAQAWRAELTSFPLAGLEAAWYAAVQWGTPEEQAELEAAMAREQAALQAL